MKQKGTLAFKIGERSQPGYSYLGGFHAASFIRGSLHR